jgi:hypothetical protein
VTLVKEDGIPSRRNSTKDEIGSGEAAALSVRGVTLQQSELVGEGTKSKCP